MTAKRVTQIKKEHIRNLNIRDHVYFRAKPHKSTLCIGTCPKLSPRFCGPFEVLDRVRPVIYQLALPSHIKVHNVFLVSLLKKHLHDNTHIIY